MTLVNLYSLNDKPLSLDKVPAKETNLLIAGDFNSQSQSWGYDHLGKRGEVETWQDVNNLILINDPDDLPTFYYRHWHTTSIPDLAFCTDDIHRQEVW